jgi:hypothetical protein
MVDFLDDRLDGFVATSFDLSIIEYDMLEAEDFGKNRFVTPHAASPK